MHPGTPLLQRSLQQTLGRAIAPTLSARLQPAELALVVPPALATALTTEQSLLHRGNAFRLTRAAGSLRYDWAIARRLYPHLAAARTDPPDTTTSLPALTHYLAERLTPLVDPGAIAAAPTQQAPAQQGVTPPSVNQPTAAAPTVDDWTVDDWTIEQQTMDRAIAAECELLGPPLATSSGTTAAAAAPVGLLQIGVSRRALALWLQSVLALPLANGEAPPCEQGAATSVSLAAAVPALESPQSAQRTATEAAIAPITATHFWMQAAHARGCSLLRQGERLNMLPPNVVADLAIAPAVPPIALAAALPAGLTEPAIAATRPEDPSSAVWHLLRGSVAALDALAIANSQAQPQAQPQYLRLARTLSQQIWAFDAACRLLADARAERSGAPAPTQVSQTQVRFMVLAIACKLLRYVLMTLGFTAPSEL